MVEEVGRARRRIKGTLKDNRKGIAIHQSPNNGRRNITFSKGCAGDVILRLRLPLISCDYALLSRPFIGFIA